MNNQVLMLLILLFTFTGCENDGLKNKSHRVGKALAEKHCQSCHLLPHPEELNRSTWKNDVLPKMGGRLGVMTTDYAEIELLQKLDLFPQSAVLDRNEWNQLMDYYIDNAPLFELPVEKFLPTSTSLNSFDVEIPDLEGMAPYTTLLHWDDRNNVLLIGSDVDRKLRVFVPGKNDYQTISMPGAPSSLISDESGLWVLTMGKVMPHSENYGQLGFLPFETDGTLGLPDMVLKGLSRPVHAVADDLDQDGAPDMLISCFGNYRGRLSWYNNFSSEQGQEKILRLQPGAIKAEIADMNQDDLPDVVALFGQGDEGLFLFQNMGNGSFNESVLIRFPATYGSTYFEILDYNGDQLPDILYVNGDNGDYYPLKKGYHGLRLFLNQGNNEFREHFFLPLYGAIKAKAHDFDQDGDWDIAAISYFPDYKNRSEEGFVYFENNGKDEFSRATFKNSTLGKWLTMDIGDIDLDGDTDIVLGSAAYMQVEVPANIKQKWKEKANPVLFLKNKLKR